MIVIDQAPSAILHPFNLLKPNGSLTTNNLGGKYALPSEFDTTKLASGFYGEGQEALSMEQDQILSGLPFTAEGWVVWKYPETRFTGKMDDKGKPLTEKHPMAGHPHKVTGTKQGENYVLMCRPIEVQKQINHAYGLASIESMTHEIRGDTITAGNNDPGMLSEARLNVDRSMRSEVEQDANLGRSAAVHEGNPSIGKIEREFRKISR